MKRIFWIALWGFFTTQWAGALDLDWKGQFQVENHWVNNYSLSGNNLTPDAARIASNQYTGYYIPGGGRKLANFQTLLLRLQPSIIVNDNVYLRSEWWLGHPSMGFFGDSGPQHAGARTFYSTQVAASPVTAHRFWAEILTDLGTVYLGRAPLHWGLGIVWNSGADLYSRFHSTGDQFKLESKFGSFSVIPAVIKYTTGNSLGGACIDPTSGSPACSDTTAGSGEMIDVSVAFKYENLDEDIELGASWLKRVIGSQQDVTHGILVNGATGANYVIWDLYGKKKIGMFSFGVEVPIASGSIGASTYNSFAAAFETKFTLSDALDFGVKFGRAPGQPSGGTSEPTEFKAFYFHPGYKLGMIMFNYQLRNFAGPNTANHPNVTQTALVSPFDNPVVNADYLAFTTGWNFYRNWRLQGSFIMATAKDVASSGASFFYNTWKRDYEAYVGGGNQSNSLGTEFDLGLSMAWDEQLRFDLDLGLYNPGDFFKFSNTATENAVKSVFAAKLGVGISF